MKKIFIISFFIFIFFIVISGGLLFKNFLNNIPSNIKINKIKSNIINNLNIEKIEFTEQKNPSKKIARIKDININFNILRYFKEKDILNCIDKIEIASGEILIERDKQGIWNLSSLFKKEEKVELKFDGKIFVKNCDVIFKDNFNIEKPFIYRINNIFAVLDFSYNPLISFGIKDKNNNMLVSGRYDILKQLLDLQIDLQRQKLSLWQNYLYRKKIFHTTDGEFNLLLDVKVLLPDKKFYLYGECNILDGKMYVKNISSSLNNISAKVNFTNKDIFFDKLQFEIGSGKVIASGFISIPHSEILFSGLALDVSSNDLGKYASNFSGIFSSSFTVAGKTSSPVIRGSFFSKYFEIYNAQFRNVSFNFNYYNDMLFITDLNSEAYSGEIKAQSFLKLKNYKGIFEMNCENINFKNFENLKNIDYKSKKVLSPELYGTINFYNSKVDEINFSEINSVVEYKNNNLQLKTISLESENGKIIATGSINSKDLDLSITAFDINLDKINRLQKHKEKYSYSGDLSFSGNVSGNINSPVFAGEFTLKNPELSLLEKNKKLRFDELSGSANISLSKLEVDRVILKKDNTVFSVSGNIDYGDKKNIDLKIKSTNINIADLLEDEIVKNYKLQAQSVGYASISGWGESLKIEGNVDIDKSSFLNQEISEGDIDFIYEKDGLKIQDTYFNIKEGQIKVSGLGDFKNKNIDMDFVLENINIADINLIKNYYNNIDGKLQGFGKLQGSFDLPDVNFELYANKIKLDHRKIENLNISLSGNKNSVEISEKISFEKGEITSSQKITFYNDKYLIDATGKIEDVNTDDVFSIIKIMPKIDFSSRVYGEFNIKTEAETELNKINSLKDIKLNNTEGRMSFKATENIIEGQKIDEIKTVCKIKQDAIDIEEFQILQEDEIIQGYGTLSFKGENNLYFEGSSVNLSILQGFLKGREAPSGRINFDLTFKGKFSDPDIIATIEGNNISLSKYYVDSIRCDLNLTKDLISIKNFLIDKNNQQLQAVANIPFDWENKKIYRDRDIVVDLITQGGNLSLLSDFFENVEYAGGELFARAFIRGTLKDLKLNGEIELIDGVLKLEELQESINNIKLKIYLVDDKIIFNTCEGKISYGNFNISGEVTIKDFTLDRWNLALSAKKIPLEYSTFSGIVSSNLLYSGTNDLQKLTGEISLNNSIYTLSLFPQEGFSNIPYLSKILYDIILIVGDDVWVKNNALRMQTKGKLHFKGTLNEPIISGELTSNRGNLSYFDTVFKLSSARIYFSKLYSFQPNIEASATTELKIAKENLVFIIPVNLKVSGELNDMKVNIDYDDREYFLKTGGEQLTKRDIISYLAYKQTVDEILKGDITEVMKKQTKGFVETNLRLHLFDELETEIEKAFGLSEFRIEYDMKEQYNIKIGKSLHRNIYVSYLKTFSIEQNDKFNIEYNLFKNSFLSYEREIPIKYSIYKIGLMLKYSF